jgi:predicted acylesterase/phospholipase RssA
VTTSKGRAPEPAREFGLRAERSVPVRPIPNRLGLVCAGGGVTGAFYEMGTLAAIEDRLEDSSLNDFDVFVGVSAGAYIAALLANGVTPGALFRTVTRPPATLTIDELALFKLNAKEIGTRLATAPLTVLDAAWQFYKNRRETTLTDLVQALGQILPSGIFLNEGLEEWVAKWLVHPERTNDFRRLKRVLRIVAVELDTGETCAFGSPGHDDVPISRAVRASCTIPGLYRPVKIDGVEYIDGGVKKTANVSLALKERCGLVLCVNPIVPIRFPADANAGNGNGNGREQGALASRGLPTILDQVFRVTLHSRMRYGMQRYRRENPDADIVLFEPRPEDLPRFMRGSIMRTSGRARIAEYAYRSTMARFDEDYPRLSRIFGRHGLKLRPRAPETSRTLRNAELYALLATGDMPTRLAASLETLEMELERVAAAR